MLLLLRLYFIIKWKTKMPRCRNNWKFAERGKIDTRINKYMPAHILGLEHTFHQKSCWSKLIVNLIWDLTIWKCEYLLIIIWRYTCITKTLKNWFSRINISFKNLWQYIILTYTYKLQKIEFQRKTKTKRDTSVPSSLLD